MRKIIFAIIFIVFSTVFISCESSKDREFDTLTIQASEHYKKGDYRSASAVYERALEIKEDVNVRTKLTKIDKEIKLIEEVTRFHKELKNVSSKHRTILSNIELIEMCDALTDIFIEIENIEIIQDSEVSKYIRNFRESSEFFSAKANADVTAIKYAAGFSESDVVTDSNNVYVKVNELLDKFPLPDGF